jgi:hypothetical protein
LAGRAIFNLCLRTILQIERLLVCCSLIVLFVCRRLLSCKLQTCDHVVRSVPGFPVWDCNHSPRYLENENPGPWRCRLFWDTFVAQRHHFDTKFATIVHTNFQAQLAANEKGAAATLPAL